MRHLAGQRTHSDDVPTSEASVTPNCLTEVIRRVVSTSRQFLPISDLALDWLHAE